VRALGFRAAARETGVDRSTLHRWAKEFGLDSAEIAADVSQQHQRAVSVANASIARQAAEARAATVGRTLELVERAQERLAELLDEARFDEGGRDVRALTECFVESQKLIELLTGRPTGRDAVVDETERQEMNGRGRPTRLRSRPRLGADELRAGASTTDNAAAFAADIKG
jgi:hypothetical protein